jgi:glycosyltransferase involved in cell wall biosynthesis
MKKPKFSIIILSWNTKDLLKDCLLSIGREVKTLKEDIEIIVVDNGSKDNSVC